MTHIVVDPVTRIEGHLRIEAEVDGGKVSDAWSSSTMLCCNTMRETIQAETR